MSLKYIALATDQVKRLRSGEPDANGQCAEIAVSDGDGNPCRHCLNEIERGKSMLILAHRPFTAVQPYAELGPIFLCAEDCSRHPETTGAPPLYHPREMLMRGYDHDERIIYGTGEVINMTAIEEHANRLFERSELWFIHLRSPTNNCYHFRIER
ncbi:DUF1203 domain-containing protein [Gammaproteobacteria bacterium]|nr:DUF1203 domain-containing protein [Gammaproteobacteria bacterium]